MEAFEAMLVEFGGPTQYLNQMLDGVAAKRDFVHMLLESFPEHIDREYHYSHVMAPGSSYIVHPATLGFEPGVSTKPFAEANVSRKLLHELCKDGFRTEKEPLMVIQPDELQRSEFRIPQWCQVACDLKGASGRFVDKNLPKQA